MGIFWVCVCMYVCMYMCVCIYVYVYLCLYIDPMLFFSCVGKALPIGDNAVMQLLNTIF